MSTIFDMSGIHWSSYLEMLTHEQEALSRLKWLESERLGHDIGRDRAEWMWYTTERTKWLKSLKSNQSPHQTS